MSSTTVEEFLSREQEQLAGIIDDDFGVLSTPTTNSDSTNATTTTTNGTKESATDQQQLDNDDENKTPTTTTDDNHSITNGNEENDDSSPLSPNSISALPLQQQNAMRRVDTPTPPLNHRDREEAPKITAWREQQKERLEKKDMNEENEKKNLREQAKRELDDWYRKRQEQLDTTVKHNRMMEEELARERDDTSDSGREWDRIAGMCEFGGGTTAKSSSSRGGSTTKDLSRFRSILLRMKNSNQEQQSASSK